MHCAQTNSLRKDLSFAVGKIVLLILKCRHLVFFLNLFFHNIKINHQFYDTNNFKGTYFHKKILSIFVLVILSLTPHLLVFKTKFNPKLSFPCDYSAHLNVVCLWPQQHFPASAASTYKPVAASIYNSGAICSAKPKEMLLLKRYLQRLLNLSAKQCSLAALLALFIAPVACLIK